MQFIIKFMDKWTKDMLLVEEFFAKDMQDLELKIKSFRRVAGNDSVYDVQPIFKRR